MTKKNILIMGLVLLSTILTLAIKFVQSGDNVDNKDIPPLIVMHLRDISDSLYLYFETFDNYPQGDSAEIMLALAKENHLPTYMYRRLDEKRGILDFWGTPYEIRISPNHEYEVKSAGPNGLFGDDDDKVSAGKFQYHENGVRGLKPLNSPNSPQMGADQAK